MSVLMPFKNQSAAKLFANNLAGKGGHYLLGANSHWHGGMHFSINAPIQAIADGKLIAFRIASDYCETELRFSRNNKQNQYSNSFALIKHECKIKDRTLNYYSLYMHLQPAGEYEKDKSQAIPDYLRVQEGRPRDAVINEDEDKPSGLNIRNCKTGSIETTAPITSLLDLDNSTTDPVDDAKFLTNQVNNDDYKKVSFTDHKGTIHSGYALLDKERAKPAGSQYQIITNEDPLTGSAKNDLAGLNLRSAMNRLDETILKILKKGTPVKLELQDSQWSKVIEIDGKEPEETCYLYHLGKVKFDENDIDEGLLDAIHCPNQNIEAGAFIGLPGKNFDQKHCLHFEIFTDDSIKDFIKPHDNLPESDLTILQVKQGSTLFKREKVVVNKERDTSIAKLSRIKIESASSDSEYAKVTATDHGIVFYRDNLGIYSSGSNEYAGIIQHLEEYQKQVSSLTADSKIEFISYSTSSGQKCSEDESKKNRLTAFPIPSGEQKTYWVKREDIDTQDFGDKGSFLTKNIAEVYLEQPDAYQFTEESSQGCSDDCYIDLTECEQFKDSDGKKWFKVTLPFDDNGLQHYFYAFLSVNRENQKLGWVKAEDTELTSPLNWPGFNLVKEVGTGSADAKIDFNNCNSFFTELFNDIDLNKDGKIVPSEMRAALKNNLLAERLSRVIAKHPTEWQNDEQCSKWDHLKEYVPDEAAVEETKKQITELSWWDKAKAAGAELPDSPEIYHLHSLSLINQLKIIDTTESITLEEAIRLAIIGTSIFEGSWDKINKKIDYGVLASNFDGAGLSMGLIQWNIKSRNFFTKLDAMYKKNPAKFKKCYEADSPNRFKPYFEVNSEWDFDDYKEIWKFDIFKNFIGAYEASTISDLKKDVLKHHYLWAKLLHKPDKIMALNEGASHSSWKTKPGASHNSALQAELLDFFKRLGSVSEFQEIQYEETANGVYMETAIKELKWLRKKTISRQPQLLNRIRIRSFAAMFDLCVQHGDLRRARSEIINKINSTKFSNQYELLKMVITERAKAGNIQWANNSISRRMGFLNARPTLIEGMGGNSYKVQNENFKQFEMNEVISNFYE